MKSPDKIKKGLRCPACVRNHHLPCSECDYHGQDKPPCAIAVHEDALAYIEQLEAQVPRWIPVTERLPENEISVIAYSKEDGHSWYAFRRGGSWWRPGEKVSVKIYGEVTHWMPLPSAPEEVSE